MAQYDINLREYWRILKKRKFVVIVVATVLGLFSTFFAILRAPQPLYTTVCIIEFEQAPVIEGVYTSTSSSDSDDIDTQITVIKSYPIFQRVAEKLHLIPGEALKEDGQLKENIIPIIESLQSKVAVSREGWTSILHISVTDTNPVFAQKLANTVALTYQEVHAEGQMKRTKETLGYIAEQLTEVRKRLRESEDEFNRFSQENELISIDLQSENLLAQAQEIQDEIRKLQEDKGELEGIGLRLNQFVKDPSGSGQDFYSTTANNQYQNTYDAMVELLLKKETLLKDFTSKHPEVLAISNQIIENAQKMAILLELQISGIEKREIDLRKEQEKVNKKTKVLMDKKLEFDRLKRKVELYDNMTALLEERNQEALIRRAERPEEVKIVKPALLPTYPINPPKTLATGATGVMIGLILGMVIGFIVETFDTSLGAIEDVEQTLGTQVLGIIPQADIKDIRVSLREKYPEEMKEPDETRMSYLISHFVPQSMMAESFRALRTNVQFKGAEKKIETVAVTSTSPKEGKTLVAINLALTMAQAGMKVLLVGSDLRKPTIDSVFGVEMTPGLTDILMGNSPWRDTVKTVTDMVLGKMTQSQIITTPGLDNIHIITSGPKPPNPAELIDSSALNDFMKEAEEEYDMIIFDSPPILSTADAAILGAKVDGVLLVYRVGTVSRGLLKRSAAQLGQVQCNLMGVVLNGMRPDVSSDFQDFRYYSYYSSYGEDGKDEKDSGHKRWWAFFRRKGDGAKRKVQKTLLGEKRKALRVEPGKKIYMGRLALLLLAIVSLAVGYLLQSGVIDPFKQWDAGRPVKKEEMSTIVKKEISKTAAEKKSQTASTKPVVEVAGEKPKPERATSILESPPLAKAVEETKTPIVMNESSMRPIANSSLTSKEVALSKTPPPPQKAFSYPYSLQLGAFRDFVGAKNMVSLWNRKGLSAYWVKVEVSSGVWYRVFVGYFEDRDQAEEFKREHRLSESSVKNTKYANLIGAYSSSDALEDKILALKSLGYSPYVIGDRDRKSRLFVGTFVTKDGAEKQYGDLKSNGIESQIVER